MLLASASFFFPAWILIASATTKDKVVTHGSTMALTTTFIERISMGHYSHLSIEEREDIMVWWKNHESISQIARKLGRNKSSISREIKRNGWAIIGVAHLCYRASTAQRKADVRRQACKKRTLLDDPNLRARRFGSSSRVRFLQACRRTSAFLWAVEAL